MNAPIAFLSMLHYPAGGGNSATRLFRNSPVLAWTARRLAASHCLSQIVVACWADQSAHVRMAAPSVEMISLGQRVNKPTIDLIAAARRWSDGWRGFLGTCWTDQGFEPKTLLMAMERHQTDSAVLVDPDSALVDPALIDGLVDHAMGKPELPYVMLHAAPGLGGTLVRKFFVESLTHGEGTYPGRLMSYWPDLAARDPISEPLCAPCNTVLARTRCRFLADSQRQIDRLSLATETLNGGLASSDALTLATRMNAMGPVESAPRDLTVELTARRSTKPVFQPAGMLSIGRGDIDPALADEIFRQASAYDDLRVTFAGVGDPLLHPQAMELIAQAKMRGIRALHLETDLLAGDMKALAESPLDVISFHLPGSSAETYRKLMGAGVMAKVLENVMKFLQFRAQRQSLTPILCPIFVKTRLNIAEMESWYDYWLKTLGAAMITGPTTACGKLQDLSATNIAPPGRVACRRINTRLTVLSTGQFTACEEDVLGEMPLKSKALDEAWREIQALRESHQAGRHEGICQTCDQWHRP